MAAVVDINTGSRIPVDTRTRLVLIESPAWRTADRRRIYRRRRIVAGLAAVLAVAVLVVGFRAIVSALDATPTAVAVHTVVPDDTLWSIAKQARPDSDPRDTISVMVALNSTAEGAFDPWVPLAVGQQIRVPADR